MQLCPKAEQPLDPAPELVSMRLLEALFRGSIPALTGELSQRRHRTCWRWWLRSTEDTAAALARDAPLFLQRLQLHGYGRLAVAYGRQHLQWRVRVVQLRAQQFGLRLRS